MRTTQAARAATASPARDGPAKQVARFSLHALEMCVVMCVPLIVGGLIITTAAAGLGRPSPIKNAPVAIAVLATLLLAGSMTAWMRYRAMAWRPTLEMAGSSVVAGTLVISAYAVGIVPASELVGMVCPAACVAMVAVMLPRFRLYASHSSHDRNVDPVLRRSS